MFRELRMQAISCVCVCVCVCVWGRVVTVKLQTSVISDGTSAIRPYSEL